MQYLNEKTLEIRILVTDGLYGCDVFDTEGILNLHFRLLPACVILLYYCYIYTICLLYQEVLNSSSSK